MKFGVRTILWVSPVDTTSFPLLNIIKYIGFDVPEIKRHTFYGIIE